MGDITPIRPELAAEQAARQLVDATWKLARAMTRAATKMPAESLAEMAGCFLAETRETEMARPARLVLEAVSAALLSAWAHSALDAADGPDDDPEEQPEDQEPERLELVA